MSAPESGSKRAIISSWCPIGVMDALPQMDAEEMIKDYLLQSETENAKELARSLLNYVLQSDRQQARDDMTVLVGGVRRR